MDMFQLYRGNKRVTLRPEDMTKEKIAVIFQVKMDLLYLQNDSNVAIFAEPDGQFNCYDLLTSSHYEVQGDSSIVEATPPPPPQDHHPTRFSFHRPATSTAASASAACLIPRATVPKLASKTLQVGHLVNGKLETSENVTVRFSEFEANIGAITAKVIEALGVEENMVLTDKSGTRFVDSEGTRGFDFWRSNAKKVWAVPEQQFQQLHNKKRRLSRDDAGLRDVVGDIEELVEAAQNLREVTTIIKELSGVPSTLTSTLSLSETEVAAMRSAFGCLVCKGLIEVPMFATCCRSIIGCKVCVEECRRNNSTCPKCRNVDFVNRIIEMAALDDALAPIGKLFY